MPPSPPRILLEGSPGAGKTTVARRLVRHLQDAKIPVEGFTTREIRERGRRVGFEVQVINGPAALLAHVAFVDGPQVGRYRVDVPAFERIALPALDRAGRQGQIVVVDEVGRMELASAAFVEVLLTLLTRPVMAVVTVHVHADPVTDALKERADIQRLTVTPEERDDLPDRIMTMLLAGRSP